MPFSLPTKTAFLLVVLEASPVFGWGKDGHKITGTIAADKDSRQAMDQVHERERRARANAALAQQARALSVPSRHYATRRATPEFVGPDSGSRRLGLWQLIATSCVMNG